MLNGVSGANLNSLRVLWDLGTFAGLDDGELIARFVERREGSADLAFEVLVRRHGPMVLGVCRSLLDDRHAAEDAFQAVFLVLARKARSLRNPAKLAPWLYGVALKTAQESRKREARRRRLERRGPEMPAHQSIPPDRALVQVEEAEALHGEIARLPERYRDVVVLCDLEGLTQQEAAGRLDCPTGTVAIRLKRARERLKARLGRRGLAPSASLPAILALRPEIAPGLIDATVKGSMASGLAAASVVSLAEGVRLTMMIAKWKAGATGSALTLGLAVTWAASGGLAAPQNDDPAPLPERTIARAVVREVRDFQEFVGRTEPSRVEKIPARQIGKIDKVYVAVGARVKQNDVLIELDPRPFEEARKAALADVERAEARKKLANNVVARYKAMLKRLPDSISPDDFAKGETDLGIAERDLAVAKVRAEVTAVELSETRTRAPFDGVVVGIDADPGDSTRNTKTLVTVARFDPMAVVFDVDETTILKLRRLYGDDQKTLENLTIRIRLQDEHEFTRLLKIESLPFQFELKTGTAKFEGKFANPDFAILSGQFVTVRMEFGQPRAAILVPENAIVTDGPRKLVYVLDDHEVIEARPVEVGLLVNGFREIRTGLKAGENVVAEDLTDLKPSMKIKARVAPTADRHR